MTSPRPQQRKVLFLSTSQLFFTESSPADTLLAMVEKGLRDQVPQIGWTCAAEVVYVLPNMAQRALAMVERHSPDIVVVRPTSRTFMHDDVVSRIRDRWPRLYRASVRTSEWLRRLAGGERYGGPGLQGLLFRVPRALAIRVIGVAPRVPVEQAAAYVEETLDSLLKREDLTVLCQVVVGNTPSELSPREHARRRDYFIARLRDYCDRRHVPYSNAADAFRAMGVAYKMDEDQYHATREVRAAEAVQIVARLVEVAAPGEGPRHSLADRLERRN
jgi:hypothetical protein